MITPIIVPMHVSASNVCIPMDLATNKVEIPMYVSTRIVSVAGDWYTGEYEVTPRLTEQSLATQNKLMREDVTVHEIPVVSTSNIYGGQTVVIG